MSRLLLYGCGERGDNAALPANSVDDESEPASAVENAAVPAVSVESSGKSAAGIDDVPQEVIAAAQRVKPGFAIQDAPYETRDGREYYDLAGLLPDDREIELDMTRADGVWTVVEIQRNIVYAEVPVPVADTLAEAMPGWDAERMIESDQGEGTVIYEFFGPGAGGEVTKVEVKWAGNSAELLTEEWAH